MDIHERASVLRSGAVVAGALVHPLQFPEGICSCSGHELSKLLQQHEEASPCSADWAQRSSVQQQKGMIIAMKSAMNLFGMKADSSIVS